MTQRSKPWACDTRPIIAARLPSYEYGGDGIFLTSDGWLIERIEQNGEMAPVPYLRMTKNDQSIEAALGNFAWVEVKDSVGDEG
jgi:hypothetical protein